MFTPSHFSIHLFYPHDLFFHSEGWILEPVFLFTLTLLKHGVMCLQWSLSAACHSSLWRSTTTVLYYSTVRKNGVYMDLENKFTTWVTFLHISGTLPLWNTYVSIKAKEKNRRTVQVWAKSGYLIKFPWILFFILGSAQFTSVDLSQELQLGRLVSVKWTWPFSSDYCLVGSLWVFRAPRWFSFADTEEMKHWRENDYSWGNCMKKKHEVRESLWAERFVRFKVPLWLMLIYRWTWRWHKCVSLSCQRRSLLLLQLLLLTALKSHFLSSYWPRTFIFISGKKRARVWKSGRMACGFCTFWADEWNVRWFQSAEEGVTTGSRGNERIKWPVWFPSPNFPFSSTSWRLSASVKPEELSRRWSLTQKHGWNWPWRQSRMEKAQLCWKD